VQTTVYAYYYIIHTWLVSNITE